jgi:TRAP-type C4-dicarboxylate transport system permease small subunit
MKISAQNLATWIVGIAVIIGGATFIYKLVEFAMTAGNEDMPGFALVSVVPYFAATAGFLFLAVWAFFRGHFRDIEGPKHRMLEQERAYEEAEKRAGVKP